MRNNYTHATRALHFLHCTSNSCLKRKHRLKFEQYHSGTSANEPLCSGTFSPILDQSAHHRHGSQMDVRLYIEHTVSPFIQLIRSSHLYAKKLQIKLTIETKWNRKIKQNDRVNETTGPFLWEMSTFGCK